MTPGFFINVQKVFSDDRLDDAYVQLMKFCLMNPKLGPVILSRGYISAVFAGYVDMPDPHRVRALRQVEALLPTVTRAIEASLRGSQEPAEAIEGEAEAIRRVFGGVGDEEWEKLVTRLPKAAGKK